MKDILLWVVAITVILIFTFGAHVFSAYHEAKAYERVTGRHVSTWDAMFLELRTNG